MRSVPLDPDHGARSSSASACVIQRIVIEPNRVAAEHNQLLLTLGLALFLENLALVLWQGDFRTLRVSYSRRPPS